MTLNIFVIYNINVSLHSNYIIYHKKVGPIDYISMNTFKTFTLHFSVGANVFPYNSFICI